jgi:uncharacterized membrane protein
MYPRARLDALSDAIFGVAMTLLVLDPRLPDEFHPAGAPELLEGFYHLGPKFIPYVLSFVVLGLRWKSGVQVHNTAESVERGYFRWWLFYLLLIYLFIFEFAAFPAERRLNRGTAALSTSASSA